MASSSKKKKSASSSKASPLVSMRRKKEVLGVVLIFLAVLLAMAFASHAPADDDIAARIQLADALFNQQAHPEQFRVQNFLGLVGAEIARVMVPGFLGYTVLLLTGLIGVWGYAIFRHLNLRRLAYGSGLTLLSAFVLATLIGWFGHVLQVDLVYWGGAVGMGVAGWMQRVFGSPGSLILLLLIVAVTTLLVIDHDVQRTIDRLVDALHAVRTRVQTWWEQLRTRRAERKSARKEIKRDREERTSDLEKRKAEREEKLEAERKRRREAEEAARRERERREKEKQEREKLQKQRQEQERRDKERLERELKAQESSTGEPPSSSAEGSDESSDDTDDLPPAASSDGRADPPAEDTGSSRAAITIGADGRPIRRNDLFRDRLHQAAQSDAPIESERASDAPASDDTSEDSATGDGASASSNAPRTDDPEGEEALGGHLQTQELDLNELEAEFGEAFDAADEQAEQAEVDEDADLNTLDLSQVDAAASERDETPDDAETVEAEAGESDEDDAGEGDAEDDVHLEVQERVEEEKADHIERDPKTPEDVEYVFPGLDLLDEATAEDSNVDIDELEENKRVLLDKLKTYNIEIQEIKAVVGPTVTRYEMTPAPGIKVSRIKSLEDDLAMALAAPGIRMIAPIPGKSAVGVEIPNRKRELVRLRDVLGTAKFRDTDLELPIPLGKSIEGDVFLADLTKMPHLLIAGATGSGKSVGLNTLITGLLYACHPTSLKFVIIDPKKIELQQYTHLREHFMARPEDLDEAVITDVDQALGVLKSCEKEMESRYDLLSEASVRGVRSYNRKFREGKLSPEDGHHFMPYIVVVVDEFADLMMTAGKEIEGPIARLAQMARAVGIHLVLATQRPSVDVITGLIKANFPSRIAFEVASRVDSRTILDQIGAEGLVGNGDMLFQSGSKLKRLQGPFVSVEEVERIVDFIADQGQSDVEPYLLPSLSDAGHGPDVTLGVEDTDELFEKGARVIVRRQQGSVSLLQRKLAVGYTRAARIVDQLEEAGIVGPFNGTKARDVLVENEDELDELFDKEE